MSFTARTGALVLAFLTLTATMFLPTPASADVLYLKGGDRLTGKVVDMDSGKLTFTTSYAGKLKIKWAEVVRLITDEPMTVETTEGQTLTGKAQEAGPGRIKLGGGQALPLSQVASINPEDLEPFKLDGQINLGVDISRGNTNKMAVDTTGRVVTTWKTINRAIGGFEIHRAESKGKDTTDNTLGYVEYNRFVSDKWYWLANLRGSQDTFKNIEYQSMAGVGMGYQLWQSKLTNLSFELGPNYVYQEDTAGVSEDWYAIRWKISYDRWFLSRSVQFYHRQEGFIAVDNADNWIWTTRQGLNFPTVLGFVLTAAYNLDYDNEPEPGKSKTDTRFIISLGYQF
ncbi:MAG: DUF481 domain-containing protein [Desulfarculaceae bacterium]|nr:DUF481 domain-containing protein [Desulfarculaceae bacterium]MCF8048118.1 DUF481 domain-containing protein [Desulfarculaceae bacterium]MCF8099701.1 DUF481 domain-containing protein [Desulfarculaceae bacterium]MCF8123086.1 DUF481 domain-containing protein [Desulfarculaceae bacterium]